MLASLTESREHERRLIDDAAHELRTPLTSLRTNIEVLATGKLTDPDDHAALLHDLRSQTAEFAALIGDLETVARNRATDNAPTRCRLDDIVEAAVRRAQRRAGDIAIELTTNNPSAVQGDWPMLERAVLNVLEKSFSRIRQPGRSGRTTRRHVSSRPGRTERNHRHLVHPRPGPGPGPMMRDAVARFGSVYVGAWTGRG